MDFQIGSNEVVGLIGDNGAGKSTLIKIMSGLHPLDSGNFYIRDNKIDSHHYSVEKAQELGIETVYQESSLGEKHPVWRNIFVGRELTTSLGFLCVAKMKQETHEIMKDVLGFRGAGMSTDSTVSTMSGGERQGVVISRAMYFDADLVILDEPTRALSVKEIGKVLNFVQKIKERGKSCVYISHTISLIYEVSDRFVILDRGKVSAEYARKEISEDELMKQLIYHASQT
ncbi:MAG TPA: ATP-binding cassette domain-containing protein [Atribacteraceae bacterium]|nr:ATP-binding cassette domain-containing protein [Atribacteraceae bacterium]